MRSGVQYLRETGQRWPEVLIAYTRRSRLRGTSRLKCFACTSEGGSLENVAPSKRRCHLTKEKACSYEDAESDLRVCCFEIVVVDRADGCGNVVAAIETSLDSGVPRLKNMVKAVRRNGQALVHEYHGAGAWSAVVMQNHSAALLTY